MESNRNDFDRNIREALMKYESRFKMPDNLIADTIADITRQKERKAYVRGLIAASVSVVFMIACAVGLFLYFYASSPAPVFSTNFSVDHTVHGVTSTMSDIFSNPLIIMVAIAAAVLLSLDHLMRSWLAGRRHPEAMEV